MKKWTLVLAAILVLGLGAVTQSRADLFTATVSLKVYYQNDHGNIASLNISTATILKDVADATGFKKGDLTLVLDSDSGQIICVLKRTITDVGTKGDLIAEIGWLSMDLAVPNLDWTQFKSYGTFDLGFYGTGTGFFSLSTHWKNDGTLSSYSVNGDLQGSVLTGTVHTGSKFVLPTL
jgi:hypothetical protein